MIRAKVCNLGVRGSEAWPLLGLVPRKSPSSIRSVEGISQNQCARKVLQYRDTHDFRVDLDDLPRDPYLRPIPLMKEIRVHLPKSTASGPLVFTTSRSRWFFSGEQVMNSIDCR